jgi:hypothetical protein
MEAPDINPFAGFQGGLVAESPLFPACGLFKSDGIDPTLLTSVGAYQDANAGASGQKLVHGRKILMWHRDWLVASVISPELPC